MRLNRIGLPGEARPEWVIGIIYGLSLIYVRLRESWWNLHQFGQHPHQNHGRQAPKLSPQILKEFAKFCTMAFGSLEDMIAARELLCSYELCHS